MKHYITLTNSELNERISEMIHSERDRKIMRMRLIEGFTIEKIADMQEMSPRQIHAIIKKLSEIIVPS